MSCTVVDGAQMLLVPFQQKLCYRVYLTRSSVMGGNKPNDTDCDAYPIYGLHNMYLGKQNPEDAVWAMFRPNITSYEVPSEIISAVGGSYVLWVIAAGHLKLTISIGPQGGPRPPSPRTALTTVTCRFSLRARIPLPPAHPLARSQPHRVVQSLSLLGRLWVVSSVASQGSQYWRRFCSFT